MKNLKSILLIIVVIAVFIGAAALMISIVKGAVNIVGGIFDTILGIVIILALLVLVIWMFAYAKKKRK